MAYWGSKPADSDYAFGSIGVYVLLIVRRMFDDMDNVLKKSHPEQGIIASLTCLRVIGLEFPKCLRVHFGRREFEKAKAGFEGWYELVKDKLPSEHKDAIWSEAMQEFERFEKEILWYSAKK